MLPSLTLQSGDTGTLTGLLRRSDEWRSTVTWDTSDKEIVLTVDVRFCCFPPQAVRIAQFKPSTSSSYNYDAKLICTVIDRNENNHRV